jgi:hypothetical protein
MSTNMRSEPMDMKGAQWCPLGIVLLALAAGLTGCGEAVTRDPVPMKLAHEAQVVGIRDVRAWGGEHSPLFQKNLIESIRRARRHDPRGVVDKTGAVSILTISGGGADGAFGAGFLCGWSKAGTRPPFKLVTGISTGALIAPYAFLGSDYDQRLKEVYTTITTKDILTEKGMLFAIGSDSLAESAPLANLLETHVTEEVLRDVAKAYAAGRLLYIGTTNLDARRLVVWDMGAIASSGHPGAPDLFRKVMLASASIPVAFPPVYVPVEAGGKTYDEMHVDGGVTTEVFFYGAMLDLEAAERESGATKRPPAHLYILRNSQIRVQWKAVTPKLMPIAERSIGSLIAMQALGDIYRIHAFTKRDGIDFNLAAIPDDYVPAAKEAFDREEMNRLFDLGFQLAASGYKWQKHPPGLKPSE